jgi:hypothetical protein
MKLLNDLTLILNKTGQIYCCYKGISDLKLMLSFYHIS